MPLTLKHIVRKALFTIFIVNLKHNKSLTNKFYIYNLTLINLNTQK